MRHSLGSSLKNFTLLWVRKFPAVFTYFTGVLLCLRQSLLKKELRRRLKSEGKKQGSALCDRVFAYVWDSFYFQLCVCVWVAHVCIVTCRGQKMATDSSGLDLQVDVDCPKWMLRTKRGSSARTASSLNFLSSEPLLQPLYTLNIMLHTMENLRQTQNERLQDEKSHVVI